MQILLRSATLWSLLILFIVFTLAFGVFRDGAGGVLLDGLSDPNEILTLLQNMTPAEKSVHFNITLYLDMPYPVIYGGLFALSAFRFGGSWLLAIPALLVIPVDVVENTIQLLALSGVEDYILLKQWLTPLKFTLFAMAAIIASGAALFHLIRKIVGG
jgi:hypothetical protein